MFCCTKPKRDLRDSSEAPLDPIGVTPTEETTLIRAESTVSTGYRVLRQPASDWSVVQDSADSLGTARDAAAGAPGGALNIFNSSNRNFAGSPLPIFGTESASPIEIGTSLPEELPYDFPEAAAHSSDSRVDPDELMLTRKESESRLQDMFPDAEPEAVAFILEDAKDDLAVAVRQRA